MQNKAGRATFPVSVTTRLNKAKGKNGIRAVCMCFYLFIYLFIYSFIHSFIHSFICSIF